MTTAQEAKGPTVAELQRFIREKTNLEFILTNGDRERGTLKWFDEHAFCVQQDNGTVTLLRSGVIGYRAKA
ncbi:MAG TPA: hypothetical protein V6C69_16075 [Trichormus sp.]|jgi:hypothetical protein